jgi:uncharacterized protein YwqG
MSAAAVIARIRGEAAQCLRLDGTGASRSQIGGLPNLGPAISWPTWKERTLSFLAQIDLAELRAAHGPDWLPEQGMLFFFYDPEEGGWGFSPDDKGSFAVLYDPNAGSVEARPPPTPAPELFPAQAIAMHPYSSLPTPERLGIDIMDLVDSDQDAVDALRDEGTGEGPLHQIGGWPYPIQNDIMELECQLASNGIDCGGVDGFASDQAKALAPGASEWRLLLQLDSDDYSDMMWGDSGILYFWIREADARAGDFSNAWMILQCC